MSETEQSQQIRLAAANAGCPLLRNNNGAAVDQDGRMIRFGLGNDSKKISEVFKSSDLIGITPVTITPDMVGRTIGVFTAVEVKHAGWVFSGNSRELAQRNFGEWVQMHGGLFSFATKPEEIPKWSS